MVFKDQGGLTLTSRRCVGSRCEENLKNSQDVSFAGAGGAGRRENDSEDQVDEFENLQVASGGRSTSWSAEVSRLASAKCGISHDSLDCHTIHVHALSRLAGASVGVGFGDCVGVGVGVGGFGSSGVVNVRDYACMDGTLHDVIHSVPACTNSRIQGFTEYLDDSCAQLNAFLNSRVERGHCGWRRNKAVKYRYFVQG